MLSKKYKNHCLENAFEITKQAAASCAEPEVLAAILETTYFKMVELAEDAVKDE